MPAPKPSGGTRVLTHVDPIADIGYRQLVGRVVPHVERALPSSVYSSRCDLTGSTWRTRGWRNARSTFDQAVEQEQGIGRRHGRGTLDVASHYPTVDLDHLTGILSTTGASPAAVRDVIVALRVLQSQCSGLPIGPEGSAVLGTVALVPLDRRLKLHNATALRWMDDVVTPVADREEYEDIKTIAADQLARAGQALNLSKCTYDDLSSMREPTFAEIFVSGGGAIDGSFADPAYELELRATFQERDRIPTLLGQLRKHRNPDGIDVLRRNSWIITAFPKQSATYLATVEEAIDDWSWLFDIVLAQTSDDNALAQLRIARLLPRRVLNPDVARTLFDKALLVSRRKYAPLANQLFATAGQSDEATTIRRDRALEVASESASLDTVRALLSPFLEGSASRSHKSALKDLARRNAGLNAMHDLVLAT